MRSILVFGVKLAILSLASNTFKLSLEGYDGASIHTSTQERPVKFVFTQIRSNAAILSPFAIESSVNTSKPKSRGKLSANEPLISFSDNNDNEVPSVEVNSRPKGDKKKFIATTTNNNNNNNTDYKSLNEISKLPFVLIDPYVYLENLKFVSDLVKQKRAFLVVPKLATDFLDNLKKKNEKAQQASEFLFQEFFCGSRIIRFIRNDDRMDLETLNYPRFQWRRDIDISESNQAEKMMNDISKVKVQDLALFYELLEHCHYLLVNKVLVDKSQDAKPLNGNSDEIRITLITNNLSKWPAAASEIAHAFGIDIETIQSFQEKQAQSRFDKQAKQSKPRKPFKQAQQNSPMFFKPIHNPRNEMFLSNPLT